MHFLDWQYWYEVVFSDRGIFIQVAIAIMVLGFWLLARK